MSLINLEGQTFTPPVSDKWYNLETKRLVSKAPKANFVFLDDPRVAGTPDKIREFIRRNNLSVSIPLPTPRGKAPSQALRLTNRPPLAPTPRPQSFLAGSTSYASEHKPVTTLDVEQIPLEQLQELSEFSLQGLKVKAKVTRVVDGDTLDVVFTVPLSHLVKKSKCCICPAEVGFVTKMRVRLSGVDCAEHNTRLGVLATLFTERWVASQDHLYIHLSSFDKYGRVLAELSHAPCFQETLNQALVEYRHPEHGIVALAYSGGTKSERFRTLERLSVKEQDNFRASCLRS